MSEFGVYFLQDLVEMLVCFYPCRSLITNHAPRLVKHSHKLAGHASRIIIIITAFRVCFVTCAAPMVFAPMPPMRIHGHQLFKSVLRVQ
jgi:hypothetical protein